MRRELFTIILLFSGIMASAQAKITLTVGENSVTATLVDNEATKSLLTLLAEGPVSLSMHDYGGFEKVGALPESLPTSNSQITTEPGDIMLYQCNQLVIFYGSNTWSYTRLGKIEGMIASEIKQFLGEGSITLIIASDSTVGVYEMNSESSVGATVYDLHGRSKSHDNQCLSEYRSGIYIVNGRKIIK